MISRQFLLVIGSSFAYFTCLGSLQPEIPRYVVNVLHGNGIAVGVAVGAFTVAACLLRLPAAWLLDRWGPRVITVGGTALVGVSILLYDFATSMYSLVAIRLLSGCGEAAAYIGLAKRGYELAPQGREGEATSYFTVALFGGFALGPVLGETVRSSLGFHDVWAIAAGCSVIAASAATAFHRSPQMDADVMAETTPPTTGRTRRRLRDLIQRDTRAPATILAVAMASYTGIGSFIPLYCTHLRVSNAAPVLAQNALLILVVRLFGARIPDRLGALRSTCISLTMQAFGWLMLALWSSQVGLYLCDIPIALGVSLLYPALFSFAINRAPLAERNQAVATFTLFFDLSSGSGVLLLGGALALGGFHTAWAVCSILNVLGLLILGSKLDVFRKVPTESIEVVPAG